MRKGDLALGVLLAACLSIGMFMTGCEDDDDDNTTSTNTVSQTVTILASGTTTASDGVATSIGTVTSPGAGSVIATATWTGGGLLIGYFKKSDPTTYGWVNGASPITSTVAASAGDSLTYYISNSSGAGISVTYTIKYISQ